MLTKQQVASVKETTNWEYKVKKDGGDEKFVIVNVRKGSNWGTVGFELVLLLQRKLRLALWVDSNRSAILKDLAQKLNGWAPQGAVQVPPRATGKKDKGHAVDFILDVPTNEVVSSLTAVAQVVSDVQEKLRTVGVPI